MTVGRPSPYLVPPHVLSVCPLILPNYFIPPGARQQIIGTVDFSDYPVEAKSIPLVGQYNKFDFERIVSLKPDLIIAWKSGNPGDQLDRLRKLGFKVFLNEPRSLDDVAASIRVLGDLMGTQGVANIEASSYEKRLHQLRKNHQNQSRVEVFYQVWDRPLMTVNGRHIISDVIRLCGGHNVFSDLNLLSPHIDIEAILGKNPQVIVVGMAQGREHWLDDWQQWKQLSAVKNKQIYSINADLITRHTPRLLQGVEKMCAHLEQFRINN